MKIMIQSTILLLLTISTVLIAQDKPDLQPGMTMEVGKYGFEETMKFTLRREKKFTVTDIYVSDKSNSNKVTLIANKESLIRLRDLIDKCIEAMPDR